MEVYYIFNAVWMYKVFCVWRHLIISFVMLVIVIACSAVIATYFRLSAENYEWQWSSFAGPFGISIYILAYAAYFYRKFYEYAGPLQLVAFVMSSAALAVVIGTVCGFVGFIAAAAFIHFMFRNQKTD
jgi:hypothetical protein